MTMVICLVLDAHPLNVPVRMLSAVFFLDWNLQVMCVSSHVSDSIYRDANDILGRCCMWCYIYTYIYIIVDKDFP